MCKRCVCEECISNAEDKIFEAVMGIAGEFDLSDADVVRAVLAVSNSLTLRHIAGVDFNGCT